MRDLVHGNRREEFIHRIEADTKTFLQQPSTQEALESNTPDNYFDGLNHTLITTSEAFFGKKTQIFGDNYKVFRQKKIQLLRERHVFKASLANIVDEDPAIALDAMRAAIKDNDNKMRTIRKEHYKQMTDIYIDEIRESWRQRDAYGANQYMRLAAGSKFGTKKRTSGQSSTPCLQE